MFYSYEQAILNIKNDQIFFQVPRLVELNSSTRIKELSNIFSNSKTVVAGKIVDSITNIINNRLFAREDFEWSQIKLAMMNTVSKNRMMRKYILQMRICQDISIVLLIALMLWMLIIMYGKGMITIGDY